jgi:hypothetical protein
VKLLSRLLGANLERDVSDVRERQNDVDQKLGEATRAHGEAERRLRIVEARVARIRRSA